MKSTYKVLVVDDPSGFTWELAIIGELPCNAIASQENIHQGIIEGVGCTITNCDLIVGITWDDKKIPIPIQFSRTFQIVGKVAVGHRCLYVPYEGLEYIYILVNMEYIYMLVNMRYLELYLLLIL